MPGNTSKHRIPYPLASEQVSAFPTIAKQAADLVDGLIPRAIRTGEVFVNPVPRSGQKNFSVTFSTPMPTASYIVILTVGGSMSWSPERMTAVYNETGKSTTGFSGRVRNDHTVDQGAKVSYLAIAL